jgi:hypothetical protein
MQQDTSHPGEPRFAGPHAPQADEEAVWAPGDGSRHLDGSAAGGLITLLRVGFADLAARLRIAGPTACSVVFDRPAARLRFLDRAGRPVAVSGELRIEEELLTFSDVSAIRVWG